VKNSEKPLRKCEKSRKQVEKILKTYGTYTWEDNTYTWEDNTYTWEDNTYTWEDNTYTWEDNTYTWEDNTYTWEDNTYTWEDNTYTWEDKAVSPRCMCTQVPGSAILLAPLGATPRDFASHVKCQLAFTETPQGAAEYFKQDECSGLHWGVRVNQNLGMQLPPPPLRSDLANIYFIFPFPPHPNIYLNRGKYLAATVCF